ncbi:c-type cytochrome [Brevifollis gellanilyticus]|uniref:c-type cytochrome n=1 Tax=Brevifollis gellanilyticus TaxID=748831 RepID=UPI001478AAA9|nr:c-type cytochrome [Brevifollis gellanilyticus]
MPFALRASSFLRHSSFVLRHCALPFALLSLIAPPAHAHPLQAEPINHAYVFNFDQFNLPEDPDEHVTEGGYLLLAELNCTQCHKAPEAWSERLAPKDGPILSGVGSRLDADQLWLFIRSPQFLKKGTQMPGLFAGEEGDAEKVEALTEYLSSLKQDKPQMPAGDGAHGKELYHKIGCVACHEPGTDFRPEKVPASMEVEKPGNASVPIAFADVYDVNSLAYFLKDPLAHRPSGRMPDLHLTDQEAADIAAYLHVGRQQAPASERKALKIKSQGVEKGRELFLSMGCSNCHTADRKAVSKVSKELASLNTANGCLSAKQKTGTPRFDLNDLQKRALKLAIAAIKKGEAPQFTAQQKVDWQMTRLNCYACHDRDGKGGPEDPRAQYFTSNDGSAESLGELAHLPPRLDNTGRKLTRGWLEKILFGEGGSVRPYMNTRMPNFGRKQTEMLVSLLPEADKREKPIEIDVSGLAKHHRAEAGRKLIGMTGLACVGCHGLKDRKSLGPPVIRLTNTIDRLQPEYFKELLLNPQATQPGTMMPPMFMGRKSADKDVESIWTYLKEIQGQPLPDGLISTEDFELKPAKDGKPVIFRSFIEGAGTHAIAVGFPEGVNAVFDSVQARWTTLWKGRFLDAMSNWQSREMLPIKPLGKDVKEMPASTGKREFSGYRLSKEGVPTMLYTLDGKNVEDTLKPSGKGFEHSVTINGKTTKEEIQW